MIHKKDLSPIYPFFQGSTESPFPVPGVKCGVSGLRVDADMNERLAVSGPPSFEPLAREGNYEPISGNEEGSDNLTDVFNHLPVQS